MSEAFHCGYVALIGRPNAGKSTLLNRILGTKLAITSAKPQTTRNRIVGIHSDERMQAVLVDTPGIHEAWTELNRSMVDRAKAALDDVDVAAWIGDMTVLARRAEGDTPVLDEVDLRIAELLRASNLPVIFVANKIDIVPHPLLLPVIEAVTQQLEIAAAIPVSALTGDGVPGLLDEVTRLLPPSPPLFPPEDWAQVTERFLVSEIVREKIFHLTEQEVPYATHVVVRQFDESARGEGDGRGLVRIFADVVVERESQKGIVIGRGGEMLKRIGTLARKELVELLGCRVYLELFVRVERDWTRSARGLRRVGFADEP
ncbi:MAG TPA: GTPase Era [Deltaproteobacteria bacterium]|nr:GTPase Era [Deltaproteobacteria bacterium]